MLFTDPSLPLAVVTTNTPWNEPPRIRHQVTRQLTREYNVLYIQLPFSSSAKNTKSEAIEPRLVSVTLKGLSRVSKKLCHESTWILRLAGRIAAGKIEALVSGFDYKRVILVNFQHNFTSIMKSPLFEKKVYFCNDDFPNMAKTRRRKEDAKKLENATARAADFCCAVSLPLKERLASITKNPLLILPGHEFDSEPLIEENTTGTSENINTPIKACFMGYINDRISFDWIEHAIKAETIAFTLVGPIEDMRLIETLIQYSNFTHIPTLTGKELQRCLSEQDVLTMPYDASRAGPRATSAPNKLFQYLACGKPIVISDMPNFIPLPEGFVYRASDAEQFVQLIHKAKRQDCAEQKTARLSYACKNSWNARGDEILASVR